MEMKMGYVILYVSDLEKTNNNNNKSQSTGRYEQRELEKRYLL